MSFKQKIAVAALLSIVAIALCIGVGSVSVPINDIASIFLNKLFGLPLPQNLPSSYPSLILDIRAPRALSAYITGAALAMSGAVMQSVLKNPLASPFGLGVSSGAGFGAAIMIVLGASSFLTLFVSLSFALVTVIAVAAISSMLDRSFSDTTIVLIGTVISFLFNALMSLLGAFNPDSAQRILLWQLGSFSSKEWDVVCVMLPVTAIALVFFMRFSRETDLLAFGEEQAASMGVNAVFVKKVLLCAVAALSAIAVSFVGIIGFVDLAVPFIARKLCGGSASRVIPLCALTGGVFMSLCDLAARTLALPREIPIGVITAILGAPFFIFIFFSSKRRGK